MIKNQLVNKMTHTAGHARHGMLKIAILCLISVFSLSQRVSAQWLTYGNGTESYPGSGTRLTDDIKAEVTTYSDNVTGMSAPYTHSLTIDCAIANPGFASGDRIMIVDLYASGGSRNYDLATITGITTYGGGNLEILATAAVSNSNATHVSTGSKIATQVLKIHQWGSFTLSSGDKLTCDHWDGHTGGILAFNCNGTLTFSGGTIDGSQLGVTGISAHAAGSAASHTASVGGQAGTSRGANATSASGSPIGNWLNGNLGNSFTSSANSSPAFSGHGGCGDASIDGEGPYVGSTTITFYPADIANYYIAPGNAGLSGITGQSAGAGGAGGGGGAAFYFRGSASADAHDGTAGGDPTSGTAGVGGNGGDGGAFIYIKAYNIVGPNSPAKVIISNGSIGTNGGSVSGVGGIAGNGGKGGDGGCNGSTFYAPGGGGGAGLEGNGPDGGGGGGGGHGGAIWIECNTASNITLTTAGNLQTNGGTGGSGGTGGTKGTAGTQGADGAIVNACFSYTCGTTSNIVYQESGVGASPLHCGPATCDCDNAFRVLTQMTHSSSVGGVFTYDQPTGGNNSKNFCTKDNNYLTSFEWTSTGSASCSGPKSLTLHKYHCKMTVCANSLAIWSNIAPPSGAYSGGTSSWNSGTDYYSTLGTTLLWGGSPCTNISCSPGGGGGGGAEEDTRPRDGRTGSSGDNGGDGGTSASTSVPATQSSGGGIDPTGPVVLSSVNNTIAEANHHLYIQPNPATDYLNIMFSAKENAAYTVRVHDMLGRMVYSRAINGMEGNNTFTIDLKGIPAGNYIMSLENKYGQQLSRFIKN